MKTGDIAPDFELPDEGGTVRSLRGFLLTGPAVLYFYPAAMTPGCTAESCHFRDLSTEFAKAGGRRVGISPDSVAKQKTFASAHALDFPLLSDDDGAVAAMFGVRRRFWPHRVSRTTFVIDTDQRVLAVISSRLRLNLHADQALSVLRALR